MQTAFALFDAITPLLATLAILAFTIGAATEVERKKQRQRVRREACRSRGTAR